MGMRFWRWLLVVIVVVGLGVAIFMLKPVNGPVRDLTLTGDVERGNYLIRLGGCVVCHTDTKGGVATFGGGPALVTPFGTLYPPNISSDKDTGIGNWTLAEFSEALSNGNGPQGHLYPAFPYDSYTLMSDQEVADLYVAMMATAPVSNVAPEHKMMFPFNIRLALAGWKNLFFHPARYQPVAEKSDAWNRGRYLALGPGHCVACHSPRNLLGAIDGGKEFTGNPAGGTGGKAPPLTVAQLTKDEYDTETLVDALKTGFTPMSDVLGGAMGEVVNEGTSHWNDDDLKAVAVFFLGE
jgi:mono/diheme cytochrome c family protein